MVSIVTINFNGFDATKRLIESLKGLLLPKFELILVDNNSCESDKDAIRNYCLPDWVRVVWSNENLGFAGGNNLGIKSAKYGYIMVLNNDTVVKDDFLTPLIEKLRCSNRVGIACSKIMNLERPNIVQFGGYAPLGRYMIDIRSVYNGCEDSCMFSKDVKTPFAHGAAMMFRRADLDVVGFMPEIYFLYFEELDWSLSFTRNGFDIWCVGKSKVYHEGSHSTSKISELKLYYNIRNRLIFASRNLHSSDKFINIMFQLFVSCPKYVVKNIREPKMVKAVFRAVFDYFCSIKKLTQ